MTTIGISLIAHNEAANLRRLLPILRDSVDDKGNPTFNQIVVVAQTDTTDDTVDVCKELGVEVYDDYEWIDDFADKRTYAFSKLTTEWLGWLDCDDTVRNLDKLRPMLETVSVPETRLNALWLNYEYLSIEIEGRRIVNQQHRRERFVRQGGGWRWTRAIHERMTTDTPAIVTDDEIVVEHNPDPEKGLQRNARNKRILLKILRANPKDKEALFDLGSQYFNTKEWGRCIVAYRRYLKAKPTPEESYQALHRIGDAYTALGRLDEAEKANLAAISVHDDWQDAWFGLADLALRRGDPKRALWRVKTGYTADKPKDFLVLNPLDYTVEPKLIEQKALASMGRIQEALDVTNEILEIVPKDANVLYARGLYANFLADYATAQETFAIAEKLPKESGILLYNALPERIQKQKETRDRLLSIVYQSERTADVTIYCGASLEDWGPRSPTKGGIGGSETAVVEMAKHLGCIGIKVDVYNQCGAQEGYADAESDEKVRYLDYHRYQDKPTKLLVAWRNPSIARFGTMADKRWLWLHDLHLGPDLQPDHIKDFHLVRPVSGWHASYIADLYAKTVPNLAEKLYPTRNGIDLERFGGTTERNPHKAVYCSSPDRGLLPLLQLWSSIRDRIPDAELHVFYGWQSFDRAARMSGGDKTYAWLKTQVMAGMQQPGVVERGRVGQDTLASELESAAVLAYPTSFLEVSCIVAQESMAAGAVVVSTLCGALPETVANAGVLIRGSPNHEAYREVFAKDLLALMTKPEVHAAWSAKGKMRAAQFSWKDVAAEWLAVLEKGPGATDFPTTPPPAVDPAQNGRAPAMTMQAVTTG